MRIMLVKTGERKSISGTFKGINKNHFTVNGKFYPLNVWEIEHMINISPR